MRPVSMQFEKLKFEVGGYGSFDNILWVWVRGKEISYASYHGYRLPEDQKTVLEQMYEAGQITLANFLSQMKSLYPGKENPSTATTKTDAIASQLKPHQVFALWRDLGMHKFHASYVDSSICDGEQWELTYWSAGKSFVVEGSNDYPKEWGKLVDFLCLFDSEFDKFRSGEEWISKDKSHFVVKDKNDSKREDSNQHNHEPEWHRKLIEQGRWKPKSFPKQHAELLYEHKFTEKELEHLFTGVNPDRDEWGDERWLICQKNDIVYFYRSWTGCLIFEVHLNLETNQHRLLINQDSRQVNLTVEKAKEEFEGLFRRLCKGWHRKTA